MQNNVIDNRILPLKDKLFRLALSITGNKQDAEDIIQDMLVHLLDKRDHWHHIDNMEAYCFRTVRNRALDIISLKDNQLNEMQGDTDYPDSKNIEELLSKKEELSLLHQLINRLPEKQRTVLQLRDVEGLSYKEISEIMVVSEEVVKVTLFRTRQKVKEHFLAIQNYGIK